MTRSPGSLDPVYLFGCARDLRTASDGVAIEVASASMQATIEMIARVIRHFSAEPAVPQGLRLDGAPAMSGFRGAVDKVVPQLRLGRELRYSCSTTFP